METLTNITQSLGQVKKLEAVDYNVGGKWCIPTGAINFGGAAICSTIGERSSVAVADTMNCIKIDTHRSFSLLVDNFTDLMFLWDPKKQMIVSVDLGDSYSTDVELQQFDQHLWACKKTLSLASEYCRSIQRKDEIYRLSVQALIEKSRACKGCPVIVVRGRKVAKGTQATIQRITCTDYGYSALLSTGDWTALKNLEPIVPIPEDERLMFYYDRRVSYFMENNQ